MESLNWNQFWANHKAIDRIWQIKSNCAVSDRYQEEFSELMENIFDDTLMNLIKFSEKLLNDRLKNLNEKLKDKSFLA